MIDWTKPIQTRDGRPAKVLASIRSQNYPVIVLIDQPDGTQYSDAFTLSGSAYADDPEIHDGDIVNVDPVAEATRIDNNAVEVLASAMKQRLAQKRGEGLAGWQDPLVISNEEIVKQLIVRLERGAWIGAANYLMFAFHRDIPSGFVLKGLDAAYKLRHN